MKYNPEMHKLSNGVTVIFDPMNLETASVRVVFFTGSRDEKPSEYGITHFCEHMLCKGSKRFQNHTARQDFLTDNGCSANASTGIEYLRFYGDAIAKNVDILIDCIGEQLQFPLFDADVIERERGVILDELRRHKDNVSAQDRVRVYDNVFSNYHLQTLGTEENIKSFTKRQMLFFIRRRMSAKNCVIVVSGKILNKAKTLEQLEKSFGFLKSFDVKSNTSIKYTPICKHWTSKQQNDVGIKIMFPGLWMLGKEERFNRMCVRRFKEILGARLYEHLRDKNGLVYGIGSARYGNEKFFLEAITTRTAPEYVAQCVALIAQTCADLYYNNSFTDNDVKRLDLRAKLGDAHYFDSAEKRAEDLICEYQDYGDLYNFPEIIKMGSLITRDDVIRYSRGFFDGKISILTGGPKFDGDLMKIWRDNFKPTNMNTIKLTQQNKKAR